MINPEKETQNQTNPEQDLLKLHDKVVSKVTDALMDIGYPLKDQVDPTTIFVPKVQLWPVYYETNQALLTAGLETFPLMLVIPKERYTEGGISISLKTSKYAYLLSPKERFRLFLKLSDTIFDIYRDLDLELPLPEKLEKQNTLAAAFIDGASFEGNNVYFSVPRHPLLLGPSPDNQHECLLLVAAQSLEQPGRFSPRFPENDIQVTHVCLPSTWRDLVENNRLKSRQELALLSTQPTHQKKETLEQLMRENPNQTFASLTEQARAYPLVKWPYSPGKDIHRARLSSTQSQVRISPQEKQISYEFCDLDSDALETLTSRSLVHNGAVIQSLKLAPTPNEAGRLIIIIKHLRNELDVQTSILTADGEQTLLPLWGQQRFNLFSHLISQLEPSTPKAKKTAEKK